MKLRTTIVILAAILITSCGKYEKLLKSTDYQLKKEKALEYYEAGKYVKATELLAQILPRFRATEEAEQLNWLNARAHFELRDYIMAGSYFANFSMLYPYSRYAEESDFMMAYCDYLMSPRADLDQDYSRKAIEGFMLFKRRYPLSTKTDETNLLIAELEEKLVEKSYMSARLYYDMKQYKAAVVALNGSLNQYPNTKYREEMMFLKLNSQYLYAVYSIPARQKERYQSTYDEYLSYVEEFPAGVFEKEVKKIHESIMKALKPENSLIDNDK
jgi:outer membrane protein assembly factor BamD